MTTRLVIAYGLIALLMLAAAALAWWMSHNSRRKRDERARHRLEERYRSRDAAIAAADHDR